MLVFYSDIMARPFEEVDLVAQKTIYDVEIAKKIGDLFRHPDQLDQIEKHRAALQERKLSLDSQLKTLVQSTLEDAQNGLTALSHSSKLISNIRKNFATIDELCVQSTDLIQEYDLIKQVNLIRTNLTMTKREIQKMSEIPKKVQEIRALMKDDNQLLNVYSELMKLDLLKQLSLKQAKQLGTNLEASMREEFRSVEEVWRLFEDIIFKKLLRDPIATAKDRPATFVSITRVIEREDKSESSEPRGFLGLFFEAVQTYVSERFHKNLDPLKLQVEPCLKCIQELLQDTTSVEKYLVPCCPPRYDIANFLVGKYHKQVYEKLKEFSSSEEINIGEILELVRWVQEVYEPYLKKHKVPNLQPPLILSLDELTECYKKRLQTLMYLLHPSINYHCSVGMADYIARNEWAGRTVSTDPQADAHIIGDIYYSQAPLTLFTFLNQQIEIVHNTGHRPLKFEVANECIRVINYYQTLFHALISTSQSLPFQYLIAVTNNSVLSYQYLTEFFENRIGTILEENGVYPNLEDMNDGFNRIGHAAVRRLLDKIDQDIGPVFARMFSKEWYDASPPLIQLICVTLKDYFTNDLIPHMLSSNFRELASESVERVVQKYLFSLLNKKRSAPAFSAATVTRMNKDIEELTALYSDHIREKVLDMSIQALVSVSSIVSANPQMIPAHFETLLANYPDATVNVVESILEQRSDIDKKEIKQVLEQCKNVWSKSRSSVPEGFTENSMDFDQDEKANKHVHVARAKKKNFFTRIVQQVLEH